MALPVSPGCLPPLCICTMHTCPVPCTLATLAFFSSQSMLSPIQLQGLCTRFLWLERPPPHSWPGFFSFYRSLLKYLLLRSLPPLLTTCIFFFIYIYILGGFPGSSAGKESTCNAGDPGLIPGLGSSLGEGIGYQLQYPWASLVAQMVKNLPARWETWVQSLGWEDPLQEGVATHSSILA